MAAFQETLLWSGPGDPDEVRARLIFRVPKFRYFKSSNADIDGGVRPQTILREQTSHQEVETVVEVKDGVYSAFVPVVGTVVDPDDRDSLYEQYQRQFLNSETDVNDVSFLVECTAFDVATGARLTTQEFEVVDLLAVPTLRSACRFSPTRAST